jgi:hypothetical protein
VLLEVLALLEALVVLTLRSHCSIYRDNDKSLYHFVEVETVKASHCLHISHHDDLKR